MPTFQTEDVQPVASGGGGGGGPPKWLLIGGAVVVGLGLLMFLKRKGGSGASSAAPTQTQESLAVGDLAYQIENGLGALGVQAQQNRDYLEANQNALEQATWHNLYKMQGKDFVFPAAPDKSNSGYSILGYSPPIMSTSPGRMNLGVAPGPYP